MQRLLVGSERTSGRGDVRRFRVVDVADAADLGHQLEPVLDPGKCREGLGDRGIIDSRGARRGRGCRRVLAIVRAGNPRLGRQRVVCSEHHAVQLAASRYDGRCRALKDPKLRRLVRTEGVVPIEMVGLEVEQHRDLARQVVDVLELERRELADNPLGRLDRRQRPADVPSDRDVSSGSAKHRPEQLDRRRLPVRARDTDEPRFGKELVAELDLAPDRDPTLTRSLHENVLARHARALDDELDAVEGRRVVVVSEPAIGGRDRDGSSRERRRGSPARAREPENEDA